MGKSQQVYTSFTGGEISPLLSARTDYRKYISSLETLENFSIYPHGGITRRTGTVFVANAKSDTNTIRLIPFVFSADDTYILEFGHRYIRFFRGTSQIEESAGVPYEVETPYNHADVPSLQFAQDADVIYIVHGDYQPRKLSRAGHTDWAMAVVSLEPPPTFEADTDLNETLTPAATTGDDINFTAGSGIFLNGDIGRLIVSGTARGVIVSRTSATVVKVDIIDNWPSTDAMAAGTWYITGSPVVDMTPSKKSPVGRRITLDVAAGDGCFRAEDVGKYVKVNGGMVKIVKWVSNVQVKADILGVMDNANVSPAGTWTMEVSAIAVIDGISSYPAAVAFYQQRLFFAGTKMQPGTVWGSRTGSYEDFSVGTKDDDSLDYELTTQERIKWMVGTRDLNIGTTGSEFTLGSGEFREALTPTNVLALSDTTYGSAEITPLRVGQEVLFVQRAGRKIRELAVVSERDPKKAADLTILAEHITESGITGITYQQEPVSQLYTVLGNGQMAVLTYLREEEVFGWTRFITDGLFASVAALRAGESDRVWVVVQRMLQGVQRQYVEYFASDLWAGTNSFQWPQCNLDCAEKYSGTAITELAGLDRFEDQEVGILADGAPQPSRIVHNGTITLDRPASEIEVGLNYTATGITIRPELDTATGSAQGKIKGWSEITARLHETLGGTINDEIIETRLTGDAMNEAPPLFSGDFRVFNLGYGTDGKITFTQPQPLPFTLLSISGALDVE